MPKTKLRIRFANPKKPTKIRKLRRPSVIPKLLDTKEAKRLMQIEKNMNALEIRAREQEKELKAILKRARKKKVS